MHRQQSKRRSNSAAARELRRINAGIARVHTMDLETPVRRFSGTLSVRREVSSEFLSDSDTNFACFIRENRGRVLPYLGVSILTPRETFNLIGDVEKSGRKFNAQTIHDVVDEHLSEEMTVQLGRVIISGVKPNQTGPRYPGIILGAEGCSAIKSDRTRFIDGLELEDSRMRFNPHISVFQTMDQHEAMSLMNELKDVSACGEEVVLNAATTFYKTHRQPHK